MNGKPVGFLGDTPDSLISINAWGLFNGNDLRIPSSVTPWQRGADAVVLLSAATIHDLHHLDM